MSDRRTAPTRRVTGAALLAGVIVLVAVGWGAAALHEAVIDGGPLLALDEQVTETAVDNRSAPLTAFLLGASWVADLSTVVVLVLVFGLAARLRERGWRLLWFPALAGAGALVVSAAVKLLTTRDRPPPDAALVEAIGYAFPSGHALRAIAVFGALALVAHALIDDRRARAVVWACAGFVVLGVGVARVYLGVHWLTDVVGGYLLGAAWLWWAHRSTTPQADVDALDLVDAEAGAGPI